MNKYESVHKCKMKLLPKRVGGVFYALNRGLLPKRTPPQLQNTKCYHLILNKKLLIT